MTCRRKCFTFSTVSFEAMFRVGFIFADVQFFMAKKQKSKFFKTLFIYSNPSLNNKTKPVYSPVKSTSSKTSFGGSRYKNVALTRAWWGQILVKWCGRGTEQSRAAFLEVVFLPSKYKPQLVCLYLRVWLAGGGSLTTVVSEAHSVGQRQINSGRQLRHRCRLVSAAQCFYISCNMLGLSVVLHDTNKINK